MAGFFVVIFQQMRRVGAKAETLAFLQLLAGVLGLAPGFFCAFAWSVIAYRPHTYDPQFVRALQDMGWFAFMYPWVGITQIV